jgi:aminoglycoside phosphotransferase (APT) family kinase protein
VQVPAADSPDGLARDLVGPWLEGLVDGFEPPFEYARISGGRSNLTFEVSDRHRRKVILRRPPLGEILPSAHDMEREFRILRALEGTEVPVPKAFGYCDTPTLSTAPFYVMEHVEGSVLFAPGEVESLFPDESERARLADSLIAVLADLHRLDVDAVGLGDLGSHEHYLERQLRRWRRQWEESKEREVPAIEEVHRLLVAAVPAQQRVCLVHGDYRLDNVVSAVPPRVAAVLDWELCTIGDPMADLGGLVCSWVGVGEPDDHLLAGNASAVTGFPSRAELIATYAEKSGLDVSAIDFYVAFSYWKLACIAAGISARGRRAARGESTAASTARLTEQVEILAELAANTLRQHPEPGATEGL